MKRKIYFVYALFMGMLVVAFFTSQQQNDFAAGYASPGDGLCADCHSPAAGGGMIELVNLPVAVLTNQTITFIVRMTRNNTTIKEGGFQLSAVQGSSGIGNFTAVSGSSGAQIQNHNRCQGPGNNCSGGPSIQYVEHIQNGNLNFTSNTKTWSVTWKAPSTPASVTFTAGGILSNGGSTSNDDEGVSYDALLDVYSPISISAIAQSVSCFLGSDGTATASVTGGSGSFTYQWSNGFTTPSISSLPAGVYTVVVSDGSGIPTASATVTITQPPQIQASNAVTDVSCNGGSNGSITLTVSGGTPGYTYNWGNGITTQNRTGIAAGTYTVSVTDSKSCTKTASATVSQPTPVSLAFTVINVTCNGFMNGAITLSPSGGTPGYTYCLLYTSPSPRD